ncbi:MAG: tetratricopeptide repeat protein [Phycisphaerales bacterium]
MSTIDDVIKLATKAQQSGNLLQAQTLYMQVLDQDPTNAQVLAMLALVYAQQGNTDGAINSMKRAVHVRPSEPIYHYQLGHALLERGDVDEAIGAFRTCSSLAPHHQNAAFMLGKACMAANRFEDAREAYRRVTEIAPSMPQAHNNLGNALRALGRHDEARDSYRIALQLQPNDAETVCNLGNVHRDLGEIDEAIEHFQKAIELDPTLTTAHSNLAHVYERTHRLEEAMKAGERALELDPSHPPANRLVARIDLREGRVEEAGARLSRLVDVASLDESLGHASIELGTVLERLERYDEAFAAVERGQQSIVGPNSPTVNQMAAFQSMLARCRENPADDLVASWNGAAGDSNGPVTFLIGFPRSGTTLTEQMLGSHPNIVTSDERHTLVAVLDRLAEFADGRDDYPANLEALTDADAAALREVYWERAEQLVGPEVRSKRFVDKQPYHTAHMPLIRRLFPDARFIAAFRDPRDACISLFFQDVRPNQGMLHYPSLEAVVNVYDRLMSCYLRYREIPGFNVREFRYEDLVAEPESKARELIEFVGEPWDDAVMNYAEHARSKSINNANYQATTQPIYKRVIERWRRYETQFAPFQERLAPYVQAFGYGA